MDEFNLFPILPYAIRDSGRRLRFHASQPQGVVFFSLHDSPTLFPSSELAQSQSHSRGWTITAHTGRRCYAHTKAQAGFTVVTEARVAEPGVSDKLNACLAIICDAITEKHISLRETSHLFLEIDRDIGACNYYFVDHVLRTVFWLHTLNTISVGRSLAMSNNYLRHALQENYWIHVGLFPETASQYSSVALNELQAVLSLDHAETPDFPYTAKQRQGLVDLLERSKDHASNPQVTTYVARLWATIDHCRLSSDQSTSKVPDGRRILILEIISRTLLFGLPDMYRARLKSLWLDHVVDTSRWRKHISGTVEDLKQMRSWTLTLLILNVAMIGVSPFSTLIKSSSLLCILGLTLGSVLLREQKRLVCTTSTISGDSRSKNYSFQSTTIAHSLPQALFAWALLLLAIQAFLVTLADLPLPLSLTMFLPVAAVLVTARRAVYPHQKVFKVPALPTSIPL